MHVLDFKEQLEPVTSKHKASFSFFVKLYSHFSSDTLNAWVPVPLPQFNMGETEAITFSLIFQLVHTVAPFSPQYS